MMLSRIARSIPRSSRSSLLNSTLGTFDGYGSKIANQSSDLSSRINHGHGQIRLFNAYISSISAAKTTNSSFPVSPNIANPSFSRYLSTATANNSSTEVKNVESSSSMAIMKKVSGIYRIVPATLFHLEEGIKEIVTDYVHHDMTRALVLLLLRLYSIIFVKDVLLLAFGL